MNALETDLFRERPESTTWELSEMRAALGAQDFTTVFRLLQRVGYSQQRIAALTGQSQPEVSAIIRGRRVVMAYQVLVRIVDGLGVPRGLAGLASCRCSDSDNDRTPGRGATGPVGEPEAGDSVGELALQDAGGLTRVGLRSAEVLAPGQVSRYLKEGRTAAVVGIVELAESRVPGVDLGGGLAVLVEIPSLAQITGADATPAPLVLMPVLPDRRDAA